jgi:hypothetical protein
MNRRFPKGLDRFPELLDVELPADLTDEAPRRAVRRPPPRGVSVDADSRRGVPGRREAPEDLK